MPINATAFNMLWGSVDGAPPVVPGTSNIAVSITDLPHFSMILVTATQHAFKFLTADPATGRRAGAAFGSMSVFFTRGRDDAMLY